MSINVEAVKSNYKNLRYTKNGNQYQKTNAGKVVGAVGMAAVPVVSMIKNNNVIKDGLTLAAEQLKSASAELGTEIDIKEVLSNMKKGVAGAGVAAVIGFAIAGLALGGLVDFVANKIKAHKADKQALNVNA